MAETDQNRRCECFGNSGLHASTHVPIGSTDEHCDLCGLPIQQGSMDVLTAINGDQSETKELPNTPPSSRD